MDTQQIMKELAAYEQHKRDSEQYQKLVDYAPILRGSKNAEVLGVNRQSDGSMVATIRILEDSFNNETMFRNALQAAMHETIQSIASVLLNERKAEIEAACNFEDLRNVLAAELARQFMSARLTGQPTPFDPPFLLKPSRSYQASAANGGATTTTGAFLGGQIPNTP